MKTASLIVSVVAVSVFFLPRANANPVMTCIDHTPQVTGQKVVQTYQIAPFGSATEFVVYRSNQQGTGSWPPIDPQSSDAILVGDLVDATMEDADTGSGLEVTLVYTQEETCVPVGSWSYAVFGKEYGSLAYYCGGFAKVVDTDESCNVVGGDVNEPEVVTGCTFRPTSNRQSSLAWLLLLGLFVCCRPRQRC